MKVSEIFYSIEGEGIRAGIPCVFIRLYGCNLHCSYCDSQYACKGDKFRVMSVQNIVDEVKTYGCPNVTITGGEPLIHPGIEKLIKALMNENYALNIETNGSVVPPLDGPIYTVDFKTNASGMTDSMVEKAFTVLDERDVIKFVVGSTGDLEQALSFIEGHNIKANIFVSPVFDKIDLEVIADWLKEHKLFNWRMQLQLHKYIWDPDQRGV